MLPEERAREKIDRQLKKAGWDIVSRDEYIPRSASAVKEALMQGNTESDYLLFADDKAIAVVEAKREENPLAEDVQSQAEGYAIHPQNWYGLWYDGLIPLVYLANGSKIYFKNLLSPEADYIELAEMHSPKKMLQLIHQISAYGALPRLEKRGLRDCQYRAEMEFENAIKNGKKKSLAVLATGSGKTYLACLASYRLLNYTPVRRILFLVDRNNLARQTESEFSQFDRTEGQAEMSSLYEIKRLKHDNDVKADIVISTIQKLFAVLTGQQLSEDSEDAEDERTTQEEEKEGKDIIHLDGDLKIPPDYFQLIIVDECHRSIYGKWRAVLDYFSGAHILGLTATPTPEAYAFFNNNIIENYTYDDSVVDEGITYAALILFGRKEALGRLLPQSEIIFEYRSSNVSGPANQREEFRVGFFACFNRLWELVNLRNDIQHYQEGFFIFDIPTFNESVVREAILNAVSHRNYQLAGSVFIRQFPDRLVIESPGGLPNGISLDNILDRQIPRNRRIAEILALCGLVERSGQGMNIIYETSVKEAKPLPDFTGTDDTFVSLTLNGLVIDKQMLSVINRIGNERLDTLTTADFLTINALYHDMPLDSHMQDRLKHLTEMGIVEHIGRSKYVLSRSLYSAIGKSGIHTRIVGLDRETNKELLLKHMREKGEEGATFKEFQQVLPNLNRDQITVLLRGLRRENRAYCVGKTSAARWFAGPMLATDTY